jgi:hypothetical protein
MKKLIKSMLFLSMASLVVLSSCGGDDEPDPIPVTDVKVEITSNPASPVRENSIVTFTVTATGNTNNRLKTVSVTRSRAGSSDATLVSKALSGNSATEIFVDTVTRGIHTYTVAVTGEKGSPATKTITINTTAAPRQLDVANAVPLFAQQNGNNGTSAHFMRLSDPFTTYTIGEIAANKTNADIGFFWGQQNGTTLASLNNQFFQSVYSGITWTGANQTLLFKTSITKAEFDAIAASNTDTVITKLDAQITTYATIANELELDDVVLFKTAPGGASQGRMGLIRVDLINGTNGTDKEVSIKIISQK